MCLITFRVGKHPSCSLLMPTQRFPTVDVLSISLSFSLLPTTIFDSFFFVSYSFLLHSISLCVVIDIFEYHSVCFVSFSRVSTLCSNRCVFFSFSLIFFFWHAILFNTNLAFDSFLYGRHWCECEIMLPLFSFVHNEIPTKLPLQPPLPPPLNEFILKRFWNYLSVQSFNAVLCKKNK